MAPPLLSRLFAQLISAVHPATAWQTSSRSVHFTRSTAVTPNMIARVLKFLRWPLSIVYTCRIHARSAASYFIHRKLSAWNESETQRKRNGNSNFMRVTVNDDVWGGKILTFVCFTFIVHHGTHHNVFESYNGQKRDPNHRQPFGMRLMWN